MGRPLRDPVKDLVAVENIHAVYAKLENAPGSLERATRAITDRRVNIDSLSVETNGGVGFARILAQRPREVLDALQHAGFEAYESQLLLAHIPNRPGELRRAASEIAAAGINIEGVLTTAEGRLALRTSDNERAAAILKKL